MRQVRSVLWGCIHYFYEIFNFSRLRLIKILKYVGSIEDGETFLSVSTRRAQDPKTINNGNDLYGCGREFTHAKVKKSLTSKEMTVKSFTNLENFKGKYMKIGLI